MYDHPVGKEVRAMFAWLSRKVIDGKLSTKIESPVLQAGNDIVRQTGISPGPEAPDADEVTVSVYRHVHHAMRLKLAELAPELSEEYEKDHPVDRSR